VEAARILQNVLLLDPKNARVAHQLGDTYRYLRQYPEALPYYDLSISIAPGQAVAYRLKAQLHWAWNGNTPAARAALEAGPEAAEVSEFAHDWFWQLIYEDRPRSALPVLASSRGEWLGKPVYYRPKSLLAGYAHQLVGDIETARTAYASAAVQLEAELVRQPNNEKLYSALGITYAVLGRNQEAIRAGLRGVEIMPLSEQPFFGLVHVEDLAWIYTLVGNREAALDQLEILLSRPSHISVPLLRLDPRWDALREHPRFRQLLAEYG
jgi:serine/threonine-protein kinase